MSQRDVLKVLIILDDWVTSKQIHNKLEEIGKGVSLKSITKSMNNMIKHNWVDKKTIKIKKKYGNVEKEWDIPHYQINKKI